MDIKSIKENNKQFSLLSPPLFEDDKLGLFNFNVETKEIDFFTVNPDNVRDWVNYEKTDEMSGFSSILNQKNLKRILKISKKESNLKLDRIFSSDKVKYYFKDIYSHLNNFDIITEKELLLHNVATKYAVLNTKNLKNVEPKYASNRMGFPTTNDNEFIPDRKYVYLEIPYGFFEKYLTSWTDDICMLKFENKKCDCYKCVKNSDHLTLSYVKNCIEKNKEWKSKKSDNPYSYDTYLTFKNNGIIRPIVITNGTFSSVGLHRMAFCSLIKSDVPFFIKLDDTEEINLRGNTPYFSNNLANLCINIKDKTLKIELKSEKGNTSHIIEYEEDKNKINAFNISDDTTLNKTKKTIL